MTAPTETKKPRRTPRPTKEITVNLPDGVETQINPFTGRTIPMIPKGFEKRNPNITPEEIVARFHLAFELIGGIERFALWADANPTEFYKMWGKLLPSQDTAPAQQAIQINLSGGAAFPQSPLDTVELRPEGINEGDVIDAEVL